MFSPELADKHTRLDAAARAGTILMSAEPAGGTEHAFMGTTPRFIGGNGRGANGIHGANAPAQGDVLARWRWEPQPAAQKLVNTLVDAFLAASPRSRELARRMRDDAGTRFGDWVDTIVMRPSAQLRQQLLDAGFTPRRLAGAQDSYVHEGGIFPAVTLADVSATRVYIKVDFVADFLATWSATDMTVDSGHGAVTAWAADDAPIIGAAGGPLRMAMAWADSPSETDGLGDGAELWVIERHGRRGLAAGTVTADQIAAAARHLEAIRRRKRDFADTAEGFEHAGEIIDAAIRDLGVDWTCDLFFQGEREYWMRRNRAAQFQKARQDKLGLGWANHDHHTYRSSRPYFRHLMVLLEVLGFHQRERFYAGKEAGWGAQVLEQSTAGITIFADVDMSPEELMGDFASQGLAERKDLGTVGLWCELHGEAFLQAGMHHLECQFDWHALRDQMAQGNIKTMNPFTTFPYLRQAFTEGERWKLDPRRIDRLERAGRLTAAQAAEFRANGAIGSHLENLERNDGFKGFNQTGVSDIIQRTDPRRLVKEGSKEAMGA